MRGNSCRCVIKIDPIIFEEVYEYLPDALSAATVKYRKESLYHDRETVRAEAAVERQVETLLVKELFEDECKREELRRLSEKVVHKDHRLQPIVVQWPIVAVRGKGDICGDMLCFGHNLYDRYL